MGRLLSKFLLFFLVASPAFALTVDTPLPDAAQEARARALFYEIRCVVCQSEAIADSPAEVARDMRRVVREQVALGLDDAAIKELLVSRYGDHILMKPPLKTATALLWFGPLMVLGFAALLARNYFRRARL